MANRIRRRGGSRSKAEVCKTILLVGKSSGPRIGFFSRSDLVMGLGLLFVTYLGVAIFTDVLRIEDVTRLDPDGSTRQIVSQLPSLTILAFLLGNYWVLRAWHPPIRAGAIHLVSVVVVLVVPELARGAIPSVIAIEAVIVVNTLRRFGKARHVTDLGPVLGLLGLTAATTLAPWVYALSGDYWTSYDTQWGIVTQ